MKRANRVLKYQEFQDTIQSAPVVKSKHFVIHFRTNQQERLRIGISVTKRNGYAVKRNKIRRQVRAMLAKDADFQKPLDLIIIVRNSYDPTKFVELETELLDDLAQMGARH